MNFKTSQVNLCYEKNTSDSEIMCLNKNNMVLYEHDQQVKGCIKSTADITIEQHVQDFEYYAIE